MSIHLNSFSNNAVYHLLSKGKNYSDALLQELHSILHEQPELATLDHPVHGSYFHLICRNSHEEEK